MNDAPKRDKAVEPSPGLDLGGDAPAAPYRVLARKYRPATFDDLIGQEAMVRTISNAFETGLLRIARARIGLGSVVAFWGVVHVGSRPSYAATGWNAA